MAKELGTEEDDEDGDGSATRGCLYILGFVLVFLGAWATWGLGVAAFVLGGTMIVVATVGMFAEVYYRKTRA